VATNLRENEYTFFYAKWNENRELGTGFFVHNIVISAVMRTEFAGNRMSCKGSLVLCHCSEC
jgi:hypothetical protein